MNVMDGSFRSRKKEEQAPISFEKDELSTFRVCHFFKRVVYQPDDIG